jgi:hypothetical protein
MPDRLLPITSSLHFVLEIISFDTVILFNLCMKLGSVCRREEKRWKAYETCGGEYLDSRLKDVKQN